MSQLLFATFRADATPPLGHPLQGGLSMPATRIVDLLEARGFVICGPARPIVFVAVDWVGIAGDIYNHWRNTIAAAAGTHPNHVILHCTHAHDSPMVEDGSQRLLDDLGLAGVTYDGNFVDVTLQHLAAAVRAALQNLRPFTHISAGSAPVERVASNRRPVGADGKLMGYRGAACRNVELIAAPAEPIDPLLRMVTFWNLDQPLAVLSSYATHPISIFNKGDVQPDFVGWARQRVEPQFGGALHIYATGCAGDISNGKHNDGSTAAQQGLVDRVSSAMTAAWAAQVRTPVSTMRFDVLPLPLGTRDDDDTNPAKSHATVHDPSKVLAQRLAAAYDLSWRQRHAAGVRMELPVLRLGPVTLQLLPGEPFVCYQQFAQSLQPDRCVMTLGYGDFHVCYLPTDLALDQGGYEAQGWAYAGRGAEHIINSALEQAARLDQYHLQPTPRTCR